jgi:hypothetical protein
MTLCNLAGGYQSFGAISCPFNLLGSFKEFQKRSEGLLASFGIRNIVVPANFWKF